MQTINLQGEQVEFQERKEKHDLRKEINSLLVTVGRVSKRQFLEYFADNKQEQVGYLLHQMVQTGEVCEPEEGVYLPDARFLDTSYYKTTKIHGSENVYADMQKYTGHLTQLQKKQQAFWVFLDFKKRMQAQDPVAIDSREFPFMLLAFFADGCIYEILEVMEGEESQLALLASKERYESITGQGHIGYGTSLILIVALILYIKVVGRSRDNEDERNFNYSAKGTYGTSRIATEEEYKSYLSITDSALETDGIILGTTMDEKVVSIPRDSPYNRNLFVAGSQGSFKSIAISRNMIIQCVIRGESFCVTDPKGELCGDMVYYLYSQGYEVGLWNLSNRWNSDGWDILQEISGEEELEYVDIICHTIIQNTTSINSEAFFNDIEEVLLKALVLYVITVMPKELHQFSTAYNMLLQESAASLDAKFFALPVTHPARQSYNLFCQSPQNKGNAILGLGSRLKIFQDEAIKRMTGYQQIDLERMAQKKTAIFCMASDTTTTYNMLNALMISMAFIKIMA